MKVGKIQSVAATARPPARAGFQPWVFTFFTLADIIKLRYNFFILSKEVNRMPTIRSSADLRNGYNEISTLCHQYGEPIFITKNGKGDLAVMSIEAYEQLLGRFELYGLIQKGLDDIQSGNTRPFSDAIADIRARRKR
jgi:PHD/YefM family antitoxin component YafN of YafNO toxin-antitoxin module